MEHCAICDEDYSKAALVQQLANIARERTRNSQRMNVIWLEATGCSGNIISFLNAADPGVADLLREKINLCYSNSLMVPCGEAAVRQLLASAQQEFVLIVEGAIAMRDNGMYNIIGRYRGRPITALSAVRYLGARAKHVLAVGTCACYGGISAARPNPAQCVSVPAVLQREIIRLPTCPCHPDWVIGTLAYLLAYGKPALDAEGRPLLFYGVTIHDRCERRSFFDQGIFAAKLGDPECMFKLGCRGPVTRTECPIRRWNSSLNWPVQASTPCIGCGNPRFPDGTSPFINYGKGGTQSANRD